MEKVVITDRMSAEKPFVQQLMCDCGHEYLIAYRALDSSLSDIVLTVCCAKCFRVLFTAAERIDGLMRIAIPPAQDESAFRDSFLKNITGIEID